MWDDIISLPLSSLPYSSRNILSYSLNSHKVIPTDGPNPVPRDWRGLAHLVNISSKTTSYIQDYADKTAKVLDIWQKENKTATIADLLGHLELLDRFDIYDDIVDDLREAFRTGKFSGFGHNPLDIDSYNYNNRSFDSEKAQSIDNDGPSYPELYDAVVLYSDEDKSFVAEVFRFLTEEGFQICSVDDLQAGHVAQYAPVAQLISERCRRIILVFSPAFLNSPGISFYNDYADYSAANSIQSKSVTKKVIPLVYQICDLPKTLAESVKLYYPTHRRPLYSFWDQLKVEVARNIDLPHTHKRSNGSLTKLSEKTDESSTSGIHRSASGDSDDSAFLNNSSSKTSISTMGDEEDNQSPNNINQSKKISGSVKKKKNVFFRLFFD